MIEYFLAGERLFATSSTRCDEGIQSSEMHVMYMYNGIASPARSVIDTCPTRTLLLVVIVYGASRVPSIASSPTQLPTPNSLIHTCAHLSQYLNKVQFVQDTSGCGANLQLQAILVCKFCVCTCSSLPAAE